MQFRLDSKTTLNSASKLKANKLNTNVNFDNLILNDLTGLYRFILSFLILLFWPWLYSLSCVIHWVNAFTNHSVETVSEVSQKSKVKVMTYVKQKTWSKGNNWQKVIELTKHSRTGPDVQFKEFSLTKQKTRQSTDYEWIGKTISKKIR